MSVLAVIGPTALYLLFSWLLSAIIASDLSDRKGYGEKPGLATGILTTAVGAIAWLIVPPRAGSFWSRFVRIPDLVTAVAALILFATLFFTWYSGGLNFFDDVAFYELLVPIGAAIAYAHLHARAGAKRPPGLGPVVVGASALATAMAIVAIATPPNDASPGAFAYVGLVAAVVMTIGAALAARTERTPADEGQASVAEARRVGAETS